MALFGLVLAFWFAGASGRFQDRKALLRNDAIAIGDFATTASLLGEPERSEIRQELVEYVQQRLVYGNTRLDDPNMPQIVAQGRAIHSRILASVQKAIADKNTPTVQTPLVNGFNGMTKAFDERLYIVQDQIPKTVLSMLVIFGIFTTFTMGRLRHDDERTFSSLLRVAAYAALVSLVFTVTVRS